MSLRHNFTLRISTGVYGSRILSSLYIYIINSWYHSMNDLSYKYASMCSICKNLVRFTDINRRRVYDIVNVLESLEMVSKQKIKNEYKWHGRDHLVQTLSRLKVSS